MIKIACLSYNDSVLRYFNHEIFSVDYFNDYHKINEVHYDVVIILNDQDNVDLIKCVKGLQNKEKINIYLIDYRFNEKVVNEAFQYNIKDYLVFPINIDYFILKIINDYYNSSKVTINFKYEDLYIDFYSGNVFIDEEEITLTRLEYKVLKLLIENINKPVSKSEIFAQVWNSSTKDYRTLVAHIKSLRKKLKKYGHNIVTIYTVGYGFFEER